MSHSKHLEMSIRPHTVATESVADRNEEKKEVEIHFKTQMMMDSVTDVNDVFATGDAVNETESLPDTKRSQTAKESHEVKQNSNKKKLPLFKQSAIDCATVDSRPKPLTPPKKYVPNYKKELSQSKKIAAPKKRISIPDELKSDGEEAFPKCGLAEEITQQMKSQLEELKKDEVSTEIQDNVMNLIDAKRLKEIEARLTDLEQKFEAFIELFYASDLIKGPILDIKLEEYNIEKLNNRLGDTKRPQKINKSNNSQVFPEDSDPNVFSEVFYETRQKEANLKLNEKSKESLMFNKIPVHQGNDSIMKHKQQNAFKPFGTFRRVTDEENK